MTLEEAIKENKKSKYHLSGPQYDPKAAMAIQLGIEALERKMLYRQRLIGMKAWADIELLPSEEE